MNHPPAKILVVDDMPSNIQVLSAVLKEDYEIHVATSGEKAVALCRSKLPDLVLLDIVMPGMDGYEVCRQLKSDPLTEDIPIIFITARNEIADETEGLDAGAIDFISKPVSPPIVRARVRNHLKSKRQADALRRLSFMDGLTGIANRRLFDDMLDHSWRRCLRTAAPLSLIMVDVDHFKAFNDHYGHQQGDECLRLVAAILDAQLGRPDDLAARFGGEEFACLLPGAPAEGARLIAGNILEALRTAAHPHAASPTAPHVSVSLGVATLTPAEGRLPAELIALADSLLYQAKSGGRNRFCGEP